MRLEDTNQDVLDLEFEIPQPGVSIVQIEEGIVKRTNENTGKTTLQIPMIIDQVLEGPEDNAGKKLSHFVPIETQFGERQLSGILTITGLANGFLEKFGENVDPTSDQFINGLKLKLPGKFIKAHHIVKKDQHGKDRANISRFEKYAKGGGKPQAQPAKAEAKNPVNDDW